MAVVDDMADGHGYDAAGAHIDHREDQSYEEGKWNLCGIAVDKSEDHSRKDAGEPRCHSLSEHTALNALAEHIFLGYRPYDTYGKSSWDGCCHGNKFFRHQIVELHPFCKQIGCKHEEDDGNDRQDCPSHLKSHP